MTCVIEADGARLQLDEQGLKAQSILDPNRSSFFAYPQEVARVILNAQAEPGVMMEYLPGLREGAFRATWQPVMQVGDVKTIAEGIAMISVRDAQNNKQVMCSVDVYGWFELLEWSKMITALDPTPELEGIGLEIMRALVEKGSYQSLTVTHFVHILHVSPLLISDELDVLEGWGMVKKKQRGLYNITRKGYEAYQTVSG